MLTSMKSKKVSALVKWEFLVGLYLKICIYIYTHTHITFRGLGYRSG